MYNNFFIQESFKRKGVIEVSGNEFRKWRRNEDITQEQVAEIIIADKSTISRWEHEYINISDTLYNKLLNFMEEVNQNLLTTTFKNVDITGKGG